MALVVETFKANITLPLESLQQLLAIRTLTNWHAIESDRDNLK